MQLSIDESIDCHSDTESIVSSQFDQLNYAMIHDDPHTPLITPIKKQTFRNVLEFNDSSSDEEDWKTKYTRTVCNGSPTKTSSPQPKNLKEKYPTQVRNTKCGTVTVKRKDNTKTKYENLCPICLDDFSKIHGILNCGHKFCFQCIEEWTKTSTNCPCCRNQFKQYIKVTMDSSSKIEKERQMIKVAFKRMEFNELDYFVCYQCNRGDDQDVLLICDMCDFYCCHVYCDHSLRNVFPQNDWYCRFCKDAIQLSLVQRPITRPVTRTQSLINTQRQNTQVTRTVTATNSPQRHIEDEFSSDSQKEDIFPSTRQLTAQNKNRLEVQRITRSKAYEIMNFSSRQPRRRHQNQRGRSINNTAMNLRNLRRRRAY